jgi:hypothetical protein
VIGQRENVGGTGDNPKVRLAQLVRLLLRPIFVCELRQTGSVRREKSSEKYFMEM